MNSANIKKVTNEAINQLLEALNTGHSEALTRYLRAMAQFRTYSFSNVLLILKQCPNASRVAGYRTQQSFGPSGPKRRERNHDFRSDLPPADRNQQQLLDTTDASRSVVAYRPVYVWDEQQTSGEELLEIGRVTGDPSHFVAAKALARIG
ncbi:MAG: hypothetical protein ACRD5K_05455 [Candidatus Acidiferrales bacterium]